MEAPAAAAPEAPTVSAPAPAPVPSSSLEHVEECPRPPAFYKLFTTPTALAPPVLSEAARDVAWSSEKQYNGVVTMQLQQQKKTECGQPPEGYKAEMKR